MATQKQIAANRRNSKLSTGPKTPEGKAAVRLNSCYHGLRSREAVLIPEDQDEFDALLAAFTERFAPADAFELSLVRQLVTAEWNLRRIVRIQSGLFAYRTEKARDYEERPSELPARKSTKAERIADDETYFLGVTFFQNCGGEALTRLARYEAATRRAFYTALKQLESRPPRRANPPAPEIEPETPPADPPQPEQTAPPKPKLALLGKNTQNAPAAPPAKRPQPASAVKQPPPKAPPLVC